MSRLNLIFLIAFVGVLIWITLFQPDVVSVIQRGAMVAARPFMKASDRLETSVEDLGGESVSASELRERLTAAERERDRLKLEVIQLDDLVEENNQLRRALQYREKSPFSLVAVRVISRKTSQWYSTVVIDKGSNAGIAVDNPVVVPIGEEAGLVGKVSEVIGPDSAVVLLLTDEMCQVSAKLQNTQDEGILSGQRGALRSLPDLRLRYLPKEVEAAPGAKVFSSGTGELFPPNLLLGEVASLSYGVIDSEAVVKPAVSFEELGDVFVILPNQGDPREAGDAEAGERPPANPVARP
ncbi:MAG TPA: rod shape-determining protein MreC [Bacteroidia bacterium]|nr:rod shape-determining protein MreC [Bacteroidia bacterium]